MLVFLLTCSISTDICVHSGDESVCPQIYRRRISISQFQNELRNYNELNIYLHNSRSEKLSLNAKDLNGNRITIHGSKSSAFIEIDYNGKSFLDSSNLKFDHVTVYPKNSISGVKNGIFNFENVKYIYEVEKKPNLDFWVRENETDGHNYFYIELFNVWNQICIRDDGIEIGEISGDSGMTIENGYSGTMHIYQEPNSGDVFKLKSEVKNESTPIPEVFVRIDKSQNVIIENYPLPKNGESPLISLISRTNEKINIVGNNLNNSVAAFNFISEPNYHNSININNSVMFTKPSLETGKIDLLFDNLEIVNGSIINLDKNESKIIIKNTNLNFEEIKNQFATSIMGDKCQFIFPNRLGIIYVNDSLMNLYSEDWKMLLSMTGTLSCDIYQAGSKQRNIKVIGESTANYENIPSFNLIMDQSSTITIESMPQLPAGKLPKYQFAANIDDGFISIDSKDEKPFDLSILNISDGGFNLTNVVIHVLQTQSKLTFNGLITNHCGIVKYGTVELNATNMKSDIDFYSKFDNIHLYGDCSLDGAIQKDMTFSLQRDSKLFINLPEDINIFEYSKSKLVARNNQISVSFNAPYSSLVRSLNSADSLEVHYDFNAIKDSPSLELNLTKSTTINILDTGYSTYNHQFDELLIIRTNKDMVANVPGPIPASFYIFGENSNVEIKNTKSSDFGFHALSLQSWKITKIIGTEPVLNIKAFELDIGNSYLKNYNIQFNDIKKLRVDFSTYQRILKAGGEIHGNFESISLLGEPTADHTFSFGSSTKTELSLQHSSPNSAELDIDDERIKYQINNHLIRFNNVNKLEKLTLLGNTFEIDEHELENIALFEYKANIIIKDEFKIAKKQIIKPLSIHTGSINFRPDSELEIDIDDNSLPYIDLGHSNNLVMPLKIEVDSSVTYEKHKDWIDNPQNIICGRDLPCEQLLEKIQIKASVSSEYELIGQCVSAEFSRKCVAISFHNQSVPLPTQSYFPFPSYTEVQPSYEPSMIPPTYYPDDDGQQDGNKSGNKSKTGAIVGVIIGLLVAAGVIIGIIFFIKKKSLKYTGFDDNMTKDSLSDQLVTV